MAYLLLILLPFAMAGGCFVLRRQSRLIALAGCGTAVVEAALLVGTPLDEPARLLGSSVQMSTLSQLLLVAATLVLGCCMAVWAALPAGENAAPAALLIFALMVTATLVQTPLLSALLLLAAGLVGVMLIVDLPTGAARMVAPATIATALKYLLIIVLGALCVLVGLGLSRAGAERAASFATGLVVAGFGIWLGLVPFHVAVADVADETSMAVFAMTIGVFQIMALLFFVGVQEAQASQLLGVRAVELIVLGLASLTIAVAPLLARGTARRMLGMLWLAAFGQIVLGWALQTGDGVRSAVLGLAAYALGLSLLVVSASMLEVAAPGRLESAWAFRDRPLAAIGLAVGLGLLAGFPPLAGWTATALLWRAALDRGTGLLALVLVGEVLILSLVIRLLRIALLRTPRMIPGRTALDATRDELSRLPAATPSYAPAALRGLLALLVITALALGLYPAPLVERVEQAVAGLNLVRAGEGTR